MSKFQKVLKKLQEASQKIIVNLNGKELVVTIKNIDKEREDHFEDWHAHLRYPGLMWGSGSGCAGSRL